MSSMRYYSLLLIRRGSSAAWINRHVNDSYVKRAARENMRSRSAYKLEELQKKHQIIRASDLVLDLGAAPGGWSLMASGLLQGAKGGVLVSVDLLPMQPVPGCTFLQGDFQTTALQEQLKSACQGRAVDVVLSDMRRNASGHSPTDHFRSIDLARQVLRFACSVAQPNCGAVLCKFLRGEDEQELLEYARSLFREVRTVKPGASRGESSEAYLLARGLIKQG